ncbi:MAG: DUF72 domain-containing protein [Chloroflexi bacterium]|nr:DUF72 domain-containing protein [Chloroflexota bacterium]
MATPIYLGTQGWSYKSWVGSFYPDKTTPGNFLSEYAKRFRAVEVDSTYYGTPRPEAVKQWYAATPDHFRFTAKFPQLITHEKMLRDVERETAQFLATMQLLGEKLGPLLIQLSAKFKPDQRETLAQFLAALPRDFRYALEVRNRGWLTNDFFELLAQHRIALTLAHYASMPKLDRTTTDFTYVRWLGSRKDVPDGEYAQARINRDPDLNRWGALITRLAEEGVAVWGFANNHFQGHSPTTVRTLMEQLNLPQPVPVRVQPASPPAAASDKERRAAPRVDATYKIAYECFNSWGVKVDEGPAKTVDISGRGALIEIPRGVPLDASMVLLVMAPFHMLMVKGSVVHSRRSTNGTFHVGVHLTEVVEGTWEILNWVIRERLAEKSDWPKQRG